MDDRPSATALAADAPERDRFLEALIRLKHAPVDGAPDWFNRYDQFVLVHGAIMALQIPLWPGTVNVGHWNVGFLPWHRQYLRAFELALQEMVPGVTLPYWDWTDHGNAVAQLFAADFLGELRAGNQPSPLTTSVLRNPVPAAEQPGWWPAPADGFPVLIQENLGAQLTRGTSPQISWPPTLEAIETIEQLDVSSPILHRYWVFWLALEGGIPGLNLGPELSALAGRTHNAGHNVIGGHMAGSFSPNDPAFYLHHANVDRIWANWQQNMIGANGGTNADHYPAEDDVTPWDGQPIPRGHRVDDLLWPWVGATAGYVAAGLSLQARALLPDLATAPQVTVRDVLDIANLDYQYL